MLELDARFPALPLVLCDVPPGLVLALGQEGTPTVQIPIPRIEPCPSLRRGRFVLYDGQKVSPATIERRLAAGQLAIDINRYRSGQAVDPFEALINTEGSPQAWSVGALAVVERASRYDKAAIRRRLVDRVRRDVVAAGGIWARLAPFPFPFRSAFNLRVDLDESSPEDYARFAQAREPIDDCSTHFVSTAAYGRLPDVMADLRRVDTQSHGHFHHVYRDVASNRRNLTRAHAVLVDAGFAPPEGFAGPHGRWNAGVDETLEGMGYGYSSDFQLGAAIDSRGSCRSPCIRSAKGPSSRRGVTPGRSVTTSSPPSGRRSTRGSRPSSTATPRGGSGVTPRSSRPWPMRWWGKASSGGPP